MLSYRRLCIVGCLCVLLSACTTAKLAPDYDTKVVQTLASVNTNIMQHVAEASLGTDESTFSQRESGYAGLIGRVDALVTQAAARPLPPNQVKERVNAALSSRNITTLDDQAIPSAGALKKVSVTLQKMRDTDKKQGLTPFEVVAFRNQLVIYLDQAITYENFLQR